MATIDSLDLKATPLSTDTIELNDGKKATLASLPCPTTAQPLDADLTAYANAANAAARRALIDAAAYSLTPTAGTPPSLAGMVFKQAGRKPWFDSVIDPDLTTWEIDGTGWGSAPFNTFQCSIARSSTDRITITPSAAGWAFSFGAGASSQGVFRIPFFAVETQVINLQSGGSARVLEVGVSQWGTNNYAVASYNLDASTLGIKYRKASGSEIVTTPVAVTGTVGRIALGVAGDCLTAYFQVAGSSAWVAVQTTLIDPAASLDFKDPAVLETMAPYVVGTATSGTGTISLRNIRAGYGRGVGLANPSVINYKGGDPIIKNGKIFFVANKAFPGISGNQAASIQSACWCIFEGDVESLNFRCIAMIASLRGGRIIGDNSGCMVFDEDTNEFLSYRPNWGNYSASNPVDIYFHRMPVLPRGITILTAGTIISLPTSASTGSHYDPSVVWTGTKWRLMYSRTSARTSGAGWSYWPVIADGDAPDSFNTLIADGQGVLANSSEGNKIIKWGAGFVYCVGEYSAARSVVFNSSLAVQGYFADPFGGNSIARHPTLIPILEASGVSSIYWLSWDVTGYLSIPFSTGELLLSRAPASEFTGANYKLRAFPF